MTHYRAATDPFGRDVELTLEDWRHIIGFHDNLQGQESAVLRTIRDPHVRTRAGGGREAYYRQDAHPNLPGAWVKVVIAFFDTGLGFEAGTVVTAFTTDQVNPKEPKL